MACACVLIGAGSSNWVVQPSHERSFWRLVSIIRVGVIGTNKPTDDADAARPRHVADHIEEQMCAGEVVEIDAEAAT